MADITNHPPLPLSPGNSASFVNRKQLCPETGWHLLIPLLGADVHHGVGQHLRSTGMGSTSAAHKLCVF